MLLKQELLALAVLALASGGAALPNIHSRHVLHETRDGQVDRFWRRGERVDRDAIVPLRIGLAQQNLETGYDRLMAVSHPDSPEYGRHLSADEVHSIFAPSEEAVDQVKQWLHDSGIIDDVVHSDNKGWLAVDLPAKDVERLFQAELFEHEHTHKGEIRIGCDEYHVPQHIQKHIDYITPGVKLSAPMRKRSVKRSLSSNIGRHHGPLSKPCTTPPHPPGYGGLPPQLQNCDINFTPDCYRAIYNIPKASKNITGNSCGLYESGDHYSHADMNLFWAKYAPYVPQGSFPLPAYIDGADGPVPQNSSLNTGESDIDIAIISSLIYPQTITLYQTDDAPQAALELQGKIEGFLNTFLDALDGSYCTYSAFGITGNSPGIDAEYPDSRPGGYKGKLQCGVYKPTKVISGSYGEAEADLPLNYQKRQCNEFMKLGLQGTTIFFSSSDFGVAAPPGDGSANGCLAAPGQPKNFSVYAPDYPTNCPYITGVGATQLEPNQTIRDPESALQQNLGPGAELFASAGGFANFFPIPSYQQNAVKTYFAQHDPGHPYYFANANATNIGAKGGIYNRGGRGIPDVSANGANFRTFVNGIDSHWFGTSLAAPTWAAIITLINQERAVAGKGPVGFINPVLYSNPGVLTDITNGSNPGCGSSGFKAVAGWDPITGLGTPKYPALLKLFLGLQ